MDHTSSWRDQVHIWVARLQNEIAPEKCLNRSEKWFEKREKGSEKRSEKRVRKMLDPSHAA